MNKHIEIKTTPPEKLDLPIGLSSYMSEMKTLVLSKEKHLGNIYHESEEELNNIRKVFEAVPQLMEFVEVYGRFKAVPLEQRIELTSTHKRMEKLYDVLKDLV